MIRWPGDSFRPRSPVPCPQFSAWQRLGLEGDGSQETRGLAMVSKGRKAGTVRFVVNPNDGARRVQLAADFTGWEPMTMRKQKNGDFVCVVSLGRGTYEYRFLIDGEWQMDPNNHCWAPNPYGTINSVAQVD